MKKYISAVIASVNLVIGLGVVISYYIGYNTCEKHYKQYYNATETMLDSIDENYMLDVIMETDAYQDYLKAKEEL